MPKNTDRLSSLKDVSLRSGASRVPEPETQFFVSLNNFKENDKVRQKKII